jgi:hypothetical protein
MKIIKKSKRKTDNRNFDLIDTVSRVGMIDRQKKPVLKKKCNKCGKFFIVTNLRKKYCDDCATSQI